MMEKREYLGRFVNSWRMRTVAIYATDDPKILITVGRPFDGSSEIICSEERANYQVTLKYIADATARNSIYNYR